MQIQSGLLVPLKTLAFVCSAESTYICNIKVECRLDKYIQKTIIYINFLLCLEYYEYDDAYLTPQWIPLGGCSVSCGKGTQQFVCQGSGRACSKGN
jgi:hypothetical protein